ncbi:zinc finger protein 648 [Struthio camelus]|uniref:zinc finger protein 648 n=1 Tax=Struthio camelus TaxID=8801 RepID=UPI003603F380
MQTWSMASPACPSQPDQEYPCGTLEERMGSLHTLHGREADGNTNEEEEAEEHDHGGSGNGSPKNSERLSQEPRHKSLRDNVPREPPHQEGEVFYETLTLINTNGVARKLNLLVSLCAPGSEPSCGEPPCPRCPPRVVSGGARPCTQGLPGPEPFTDTTVTLESDFKEASEGGLSGHVTFLSTGASKPAERPPAPGEAQGVASVTGGRPGPAAEERPYKCLQCGRAFKKSSNLLSHVETHSGAKPYACELCGKAYSHQGTLQQHRRLHTGERPYKCPFCVKTYTWSSDYRKHIRTHTGEKPYRCAECGKAFVRSSDLRKHQRNMHRNDKPFPCPECGRTFNKPLSLLRHQRSHLGATPFPCPDCGKAFAVASRMVEHQRVHTGERPFACAVCGKAFAKSSNLFEHQTLHTGERPYQCPECGTAFAQSSRLARHHRTHTGERPFACADCGRAFARAATLKRHQQVHGGERARGGPVHRSAARRHLRQALGKGQPCE